MNRFSSYLRFALLATLFAILLFGNASPILARASDASGGCGSWQIVSSPSPGPVYNDLWGVAAISHSDAWAVGGSGINTTNTYPLNSAIAEHWDGTQWSVIPSPEPGNYQNYLEGVVALSSNNVWAVGLEQDYKGRYEEQQKTLIEHWDGTQWSVITSPNPGMFYNSLSGVAALAPNDIWAVGSRGDVQGFTKTLIEHWDGTRWSVIASPNVGTYGNGLSAVTALSASDIWAVGNDANTNYGGRTLIEHWNGSKWSVVSSPNVGLFDNELWSVAGVAPDDIWTVGLNWASPGDVVATLTEHWDGSTWSVVSSPNPPGGDNDLHGVVAVASNNVWALGGSASGPITMQWNGQQWNTDPNPGLHYRFLNRIAAVNAHDVWAVGSTTTKMLIMHYC